MVNLNRAGLRLVLLCPSCAGRNPPTPTAAHHPNSSLPPSRGEVRWGVGVPSGRYGSRRAPIARPSRSVIRPSLSVIPAQAGTYPPNSRLPSQFIPPPFQGGVRWGVGAPSGRHWSRRAPIAHAPLPPSFAPPAPSLPPARASFLRRQEPAQWARLILAPNVQRQRGSGLGRPPGVFKRIPNTEATAWFLPTQE